jgi:1-aminocyclopropane-1-carboxylate deaminase/D-cysteine desulfhydrase-like pyridoxal-dependent ACC family enzyme
MARVRIAVLPTPLVAAPRLAEVLGVGALYVKRDDLTGFAFGGNKARPLEFLIAAALAEGADTLVTGGAPGSNFCAATAAAAMRAGLSCHLVIAGNPSPAGPALALARSWGASVNWTGVAGRTSVDAALPHAAARLTASGCRPYLIPRGGATGLGAVGFALAAFELHTQLGERGLGAPHVLVAVGSGGSLAGLVAGNVLLGRAWTLLGASASRPPAQAAHAVREIAQECLRLLTGPAGCPAAGPAPDVRGPDVTGPDVTGPDVTGPDVTGPEVTAADVVVTDARGPGHGLPSPAGMRAAEQAMRTEGLMVDPVYTAKALAVVGTQDLAGAEAVVFWHTGGVLDAVALASGAVADRAGR